MLSNLTAEQKNILQNMQPVLGLAADIARASITVYLPGEDKKFLHIWKQVSPLTQVGSVLADMTGRRVRCVEEPLVSRVLQKNISVSGKREWALGVFNSVRVFPICDRRGKCFGAISFDGAASGDIVTEQVFEMLRSLNHPVRDNLNYKRMSPSDGIIIVDRNKKIIAANNEALHIFQTLDVNDVIGRRTNDVAINWPLVGMVIETGIAESKEFKMHGLLLSIRVLPVAEKPKAGCAIVILQDVTELRKKDEELLIKSVVIKEIHHRVKNNLQTIASLLRLQERRAKSDETKNVLRDCIGRVNSIAIVHEYLSQQDAGMIDVAKVAKGIYQAIISSMLSSDFKLDARFSVDDALLPSEKATSIALILNELLQNTIEHGFEGRRNGRLEVEFHNKEREYVLQISDDGVGLPDGFDMTAGKSLGLKIIKTMAESDLQGSFTLENNKNRGTLATVTVPKMGG